MSSQAYALVLILALASPAAAAQAPQQPLTLDRVIALALERNERARASAQRVAAARARLWRARTFFVPDLTLSGTYTRRLNETRRQIGDQEVVIQARDALSAVAVARMTVLDARAFPLLDQAGHEAAAAQLEAAEEVRLLAYDAAEAYVAALSAEQVLAAAERRLGYARESLQDAKSRFEAELVSSNDVTRARLEYATAEREVVRARGAVETAKVTLEFLIAQEIDQPLSPPEELLATAAAADPIESPPGSPMPEIAQALSKRLDLAARRERVEALRAYALEPRMRLIPTLNLIAQYRVTNEAGLTGRSGDGFAALELTWPVFDGGDRYFEARERTALANIAALETEAAERQVAADVRTAQVEVESAQAALREAAVAVEAAEQNASEVLTLYRQGLTSALDVADATVRRFDAQVALARERYGLALAFLDLRAALGLDPLGRDVDRREVQR